MRLIVYTNNIFPHFIALSLHSLSFSSSSQSDSCVDHTAWPNQYHHISPQLIDIKFPIVAGESVVNIADRPEDPNNTWSGQTSSSFELRIGPDYDRNKKKAPAGMPLFELMGMDLFSSDAKVEHIASKLRFPTGKCE